MTEHAERAAQFVANDARLHWHDQAVWFVRNKRDIARSFVPEWEELRSLGSQIKAHTLSRLPEYLEEFERNARAAGAAVHWARDADEHNRIVHGILRENGVTRLVKSKSMLTEECHLNEHLEAQGVEVVDTDLGERIVQFRREPPSHIVIVDHGRSRILAREEYRNSLKCIRCAACLNTCPVYRRSGGHSYGVAVAGPIGSVLAPHVDPKKHADLPFASSLCGSCSDVCPVRIDLHHQLLAWRGELAAQGLVPLRKRVVSRVGRWVLARTWAYRLCGKLARIFAPYVPNPWTRQRELPPMPRESFRAQWRKRVRAR